MASARRALEDLMTWPGLSAAPARCGTGTAVLADGAEIVHFHSERQADLYLGRPAIERLHEELGHSTAVRLIQGSGWVSVVLGGDNDADLLITLASVALRAQTHRTADAAAGVCNLGHISIIPTGHLA
ncbi:luciferase family protein [Streptomyces sp. RKAG293]|uniref:luciferase domain-containing protein n=1 Tax=Streptomyces sp. RKAG293 TaxID=2893403 RepID=UPI002033623F|nr:luciferase family protein [Streptomyces sp. RKAG293]MCM2423873.1 DUF5519 family protein [Streptomyces sp. RKAG293]